MTLHGRSLIRVGASVVGLAVALTPTGGAQTAVPARPNHMLYVAHLRQLVVLGATTGSAVTELWAWTRPGWQRLDGSGPSARELGAAAYDAKRQRVVMHGGIGAADRRLGDTWEWDGVVWREIERAGLPARDHHAMVYDEARERTVLFSGRTASDDISNETWEWDGRTWTRAAVGGPAGRAHFGMAYDSARKRVVLFGGLGAAATPGRYQALDDTWTWDGARWQQIAGDGPPARTHHRMVFDRATNVVVLFGGLRNGSPTAALGDTWVLDGNRWREIRVSGPPPRSGHVMAFDLANGTTMLHGGGHFDGKTSERYMDLWAWNGTAWSRVGPRPGS